MIRDPAQLQYSNVWEDAGKLKNKDTKSSNIERTMIVVGPPGCGKTSFIKAYKSDLDFQTKPTNLIEYTFIKKTAIKKDTMHCYEIANQALVDLISSFLNRDHFAEVLLVLCLDLSHPAKLLQDGIEWLGILRMQAQIFVKEGLGSRQEKYQEFKQALKSQYADNEDHDSINPMPLQTIIIGTKYDIFEKYETENRKWLARGIRYLAHQNNASLYFCSTKNMQVGAQLRAYFQQRFNSQKKSKTASQFDHTKPIFITNGQDSIRSLNLPSSGSLNSLEVLNKQLSSLFSQEEQKKKEGIDFSNYGESRIDMIISEKKKEIDRVHKMLLNAQNRSQKRI